MNLSEIARRRLANQYLIGAALETPTEVVARLGAVQAQDYAGAKWGVAQRARRATDATVEQALIDGSIIRTHVLRPTWHFVTPADLRWMLTLTAPRVIAAMAYSNRRLELDDAVFRRSRRALERALRDGKHLIRSELAGVLESARINVTGDQRLGHLLMRAELDSIICSGARRGKQATYALVDERVAATSPLNRDEALQRLAEVYFTTRGPATTADFAWWSGLTVADAKRGLDIVRSAFEQLAVDGKVYWSSPESRPATRESARAHLLPNWDEYSVAYRDRNALAQRLKKAGVDFLNTAALTNIAVVNGQMIGTWGRSLTRGRAVVDLRLLTSLTSAERKVITAAASRYSDFLELPVELRAGEESD